MNNAPLLPLDSSEERAEARAASARASRSSVEPRSSRGHAPGDVLAGKYEILSLLGKGGMGTVWRAHSLSLEVDVAIKVLHREHANGQAAERLLQEAHATARLGHPAIVRVFDCGETDEGEPFLVMELLEGTSLADRIDERGRLSAIEAVQMLLPIASGLAAAHAQGIVHRDIKPENILIVPGEEGTCSPKIVDFGIAKLEQRGGRVLTQVGAVLGSLEYMSPEQAEGKDDVGEQTDVWALSVVLYELLTGQRPFDGPTLAAVVFALHTRAPTPTTEFAAGDRELWEIIERGLQKSPADRWSDMRALGRALATWAENHGVTTDAAGTSLAHHWLGRASDPPRLDDARDARVSASPTGVALPERASPAPAAPRPGAIEIVNAAGAPIGLPAPPRRSRALIAGLGAGLILILVLFAAGLSTPGSGAKIASASTGDPLPAAPEPAATAAPSHVEPVAPKPEGSVATPPAPKTSARRPASSPSARPKRTSPSMPLPVAPNF